MLYAGSNVIAHSESHIIHHILTGVPRLNLQKKLHYFGSMNIVREEDQRVVSILKCTSILAKYIMLIVNGTIKQHNVQKMCIYRVVLLKRECVIFGQWSATLAQWGERSLSERTVQVLFPVRPDKTYTVFC